MHEVIHFFTDLQDSNHPYNVGDKFPRDGMTVSEERLIELSGNNNRQRKPLIKKVAETVGDILPKDGKDDNAKYYDEQPRKQYTKTDINRMLTSELQTLAAESGIENAFEKSGGELKKLLIQKFGL